eukprot:TRINITY_DN4596_c0_g1_i1.p1 TRINITY_DN4596_c0_g1~~TRINITY_DN4596_c0_g1_i1.p1  ORF type:complete len:101 (-),score=9.99 TRINITY_DN4596_c0_g1_i1:64-366(-)
MEATEATKYFGTADAMRRVEENQQNHPENLGLNNSLGRDNLLGKTANLMADDLATVEDFSARSLKSDHHFIHGSGKEGFDTALNSTRAEAGTTPALFSTR